MQSDPAAPSPRPARVRVVLDSDELALIRAAFERHAGVPDDIDARWHVPSLIAEAGDAVVDAGLGEAVLVPVDVEPVELRVVLGALKALQRDAAVHDAMPDAAARERLALLLGRLEGDW